MSSLEPIGESLDPGDTSSNGSKKSNFYEREEYIRLLKMRLDAGEELASNELMWLGSVAPNLVPNKREQTEPQTNSSWFKLTADLKEQIEALQKRSEKFSGYGRVAFGSTFLMLIASGALFWFANWIEPSAALSAIDVPDFIKNHYGDETVASMSSLDNPFDLATNVLQFMKPALQIPALLMAVFGLYKIYTSAHRDESLGSGLIPLIMSMVLFGGTNILLAGTSDESSARSDSPRHIFMSDVNSFGNWKVVEDSLRKHGAGDIEVAYVTAQMITAKHKDSPVNPVCCEEKNVLIDKANLLKNEGHAESKITLSPTAIYAIEKMAFGKATGTIAATYERSAMGKSKTVRGVSTTMLSMAIGTALYGIFTGLFGRHLRRRLSRIRALYPIENELKRGAPNE